ncbi:glycerol-3-phosphate responsive antiterminator [Paenibacillus cisolokensis]|uniref:glycerol-3-phosphate responsive antiterminator n=1 Tax=Paenibacillus cisolokensis TaxID=1658519 RepID=UPI001BCE1470|nr:glycerol-3-phosphate responsive antiterminator [Paenibacillus cisolokensis]
MSKTALEAFIRGLHARPMIASVKEAKHIEIALAYREKLGGVFLLTGHIGVVRNYVELYKSHRLPVFLHLEKIGGLSTDYYGLDYLAKTVKPDGIVTTKTNVVKTAKKMGLIAIQRFSRRHGRVGQYREQSEQCRAGHRRSDARPNSRSAAPGPSADAAAGRGRRAAFRPGPGAGMPRQRSDRRLFFQTGIMAAYVQIILSFR